MNCPVHYEKDRQNVDFLAETNSRLRYVHLSGTYSFHQLYLYINHFSFQAECLLNTILRIALLCGPGITCSVSVIVQRMLVMFKSKEIISIQKVCYSAKIIYRSEYRLTCIFIPASCMKIHFKMSNKILN